MSLSTHSILEQHGTFKDRVKLGRKAPVYDAHLLRLGKYLNTSVINAPDSFDNTTKVSDWPVYGNDKLGDCTCAATGHMIQAWTAASGTIKTIPEKTVTDFYFSLPDHEDDGRTCVGVLKAWQKVGIPGSDGLPDDKILAYAKIDPTNHEEVKAAIYLFGGVYIGVGLPTSAQNQKEWDVVGDGQTGDSAPGSWGGHCVPYEAYDADGVTLVTWGELLKASWAFNDAYTEEIYAVLTMDWLNTAGLNTAGFNLAQLQEDLKAVQSK